MSPVAYVDGQYLLHHSAAVHIGDRGYQFADGVYEVMAVGYGLVERSFSVAEAKSSRETFPTSTVVHLLPVVRIDGDPVGNGQPGTLSRKLGECYLAHATAWVIAK